MVASITWIQSVLNLLMKLAEEEEDEKFSSYFTENITSPLQILAG
jgi:hypothetical protein